MSDLKMTAGATTMALAVFATPALISQPVIRVVAHGSAGEVRLRDTLTIGDGRSSHALDDDFGAEVVQLTAADVAMLRHAMTTHVEEMDFAEFYSEEE